MQFRDRKICVDTIDLQRELGQDLVAAVEDAKIEPTFDEDKAESVRKTATAKVQRIAGKLCSARVFDENYEVVNPITCDAQQCPFYPDGPSASLQR